MHLSKLIFLALKPLLQNFTRSLDFLSAFVQTRLALNSKSAGIKKIKCIGPPSYQLSDFLKEKGKKILKSLKCKALSRLDKTVLTLPAAVDPHSFPVCTHRALRLEIHCIVDCQSQGKCAHHLQDWIILSDTKGLSWILFPFFKTNFSIHPIEKYVRIF